MKAILRKGVSPLPLPKEIKNRSKKSRTNDSPRLKCAPNTSNSAGTMMQLKNSQKYTGEKLRFIEDLLGACTFL